MHVLISIWLTLHICQQRFPKFTLLTVREAAMKRTTTKVPTPTKVREGGGEMELGELMPLWCLVLLGGKMS